MGTTTAFRPCWSAAMAATWRSIRTTTATDLFHYRVSEHPGDPHAWRPERTFKCRAPVTYSNLFRLTKENGGGRIYDFYRGEEWNPNYLVSDDDGDTWSYGGKLIASPGRPYVKYAGNGLDTIHFVFGEGHPAEYAPGTGIYHAYYKDGKLYGSDGRLIGKLGERGISPRQATRIFAGDPANIAWASDLHLDRAAPLPGLLGHQGP